MKQGNRSALVLVALLLFFTPALRGRERNAYRTIDPHFGPLKAQFDRDAGKVRLLILLDPT
jgi:hypothetical protein